jgi:hypothetical protein
MITLLLALALLQDSDTEIAGHVAKLPDDAASAALVKVGSRAVPSLLAAFGIEAAWNERKIAIETVLWKIRGFRVSRAWTVDLLADQQAQASFVVKTKDDAARLLQGVDKAFPGLDWDKEMVVVIMPAQKLQTISVESATEDAAAKTLTIAYAQVQRVGCGNTMKCETAVAIAVAKTESKVVFAPRDPAAVQKK